MTTIALVSEINHYHVNGLHLFWDILYIRVLSEKLRDSVFKESSCSCDEGEESKIIQKSKNKSKVCLVDPILWCEEHRLQWIVATLAKDQSASLHRDPAPFFCYQFTQKLWLVLLKILPLKANQLCVDIGITVENLLRVLDNWRWRKGAREIYAVNVTWWWWWWW